MVLLKTHAAASGAAACAALNPVAAGDWSSQMACVVVHTRLLPIAASWVLRFPYLGVSDDLIRNPAPVGSPQLVGGPL